MAAVVTVIVVLANREDTSTAEGAAEIAVDAFGDKDSPALTDVLCTGAANPLEQVADVSIEYENNTTAQQQMILRKQDAVWCVASLQ